MKLKRRLAILALAALLGVPGCSSGSPTKTPAPAVSASPRVLTDGKMVVRDKLDLTPPAGWQIEWDEDDSSWHVATVRKTDASPRDSATLYIGFPSQTHLFHRSNSVDPEIQMDANLNLYRIRDEKGGRVTLTDLQTISIDNADTRAYYFEVGDQTTGQRCERYLVLRSDGLWEFSIISPRSTPIPPQLRAAILAAKWTQSPSPNVPVLS
ncbi:hypothetical protein [Buchananella hordeovulneris]|uniref:hypothetical protein n=1 Tax=Buchananella hordeovulneris TaxID=52770 RepID=UPI000F5DD2ED|nr:hypothetical protein [Buchananella hordeovulneris]RRD44958.1 hypothetical protein EII13_01990 [Buchananella hordeovulneris]